MTHEEKVNYMRIAAGVAGMGFTNHQLDLLISLYDVIIEKEGMTNLQDIIKVEMQVDERELINKTNDKTKNK